MLQFRVFVFFKTNFSKIEQKIKKNKCKTFPFTDAKNNKLIKNKNYKFSCDIKKANNIVSINCSPDQRLHQKDIRKGKKNEMK